MKVIRAKTAGFCFGVKRAVNTVYEEVEKGVGPIYTYGPIIHNEEVVHDLEKKGVSVLNSPEELETVTKGTVIIRSHGVSRDIYEIIEKNGLHLVDATCPFVLKIHNIVRKESEADDMARALRFIRANHEKLHVEEDKIALLTFGEMKASARKLFFHSKRIKDVTHRYDALKCEPEELWIMGASDEDADKTGVFFSGSHYSLADDSREWLETRIRKLSENAEIEEKINEGEQAE